MTGTPFTVYVYIFIKFSGVNEAASLVTNLY